MAFNATELTKERHSTHGDFSDNAMISQHLKEYLSAQAGWAVLSDVQREAIDMIALKLSRITSMAANPNEPDHWRDIAGYATLVVQDLTNTQVGKIVEVPKGLSVFDYVGRDIKLHEWDNHG